MNVHFLEANFVDDAIGLSSRGAAAAHATQIHVVSAGGLCPIVGLCRASRKPTANASATGVAGSNVGKGDIWL
jgi:hypothetical protein